jgi:sec-independent protein translocase protein TatB
MFDFGIGYSELFLIAVVAVIVIGPKDLPRVLRAFGKTVAKMRTMAREFQGHLDSAMKDAGLEDVKKEIQALKTVGIDEPAAKKAAPAATVANNDFDKYFGAPEAAAEAAPDATSDAR